MTSPAIDHPRFDVPRTTQRPDEVLRALNISLDQLIPPQPPLPELADPPSGRVEAPIDEPLVPVAHRHIRLLSNYFHAGWAEASIDVLLRASVAHRLAAVADSLPRRFGLAIFDAHRPLPLQSELWDAAYADPSLPPGFVADPIPDPETPPPHLTGGTVDLTLTIDGIPLALGTDFDDFSDLAWTASLEDQPGPDRELRRLLVAAMRAQGFVVLHCEWWHFEHGTRRWAAITGNAPKYGPAVR